MKKLKRFCLIFFILFSVTGCDHATKLVAKNNLSSSPPISFLKDLVVLQYAENTGAFLSLGSELPHELRFWIFVFIPCSFILGLIIHIFTSSNLTNFETVSLSLIIGGGIGNLSDRIFRSGHVIDFLNIGIGPIRTGIFNIADVAIMCGFTFLILPLTLRHMKISKIN